MLYGFHKPPSLLTERNFKQLSLGYAKEIKVEIEWKIGGWYEELGFWLRFNLE